jgi:hypothetical protein
MATLGITGIYSPAASTSRKHLGLQLQPDLRANLRVNLRAHLRAHLRVHR